MNNENAIEVRNMSKRFKVDYDKAHTLKDKLLFWRTSHVEIHEVLKNINMDIKKGETVALIGTKIIFPNEGTIETNGKLTSLLELGAGFHQDFTGRENIYFNASIFGLTRKEIDARIQDIIDFSELGEFIDHPVRTYSSGMYMRLAFSVAINVDAEILLIDEILAVGDQHFQEKCYRKLKELKDSDKTIVIVTHSLDVVKDLCDRAVWIYKGELKLDGDPIYVIDEYLKQVALDHKEEKKKAIAEGKHRFKGAVFIDKPKDFVKVQQTSEVLKCHGWQISDHDDAVLKITVDRQDVFEAYQEVYAGDMNPDTIGWQTSIDLTNLTLGNHRLLVQCLEPNGNILAEKSIQFVLE